MPNNNDGDLGVQLYNSCSGDRSGRSSWRSRSHLGRPKEVLLQEEISDKDEDSARCTEHVAAHLLHNGDANRFQYLGLTAVNYLQNHGMPYDHTHNY